MSTGNEILYSPVPALQAFVTAEAPDESRIELLSNNLLKAQMDLSRLVMYGKESEQTTLIRYAMSVIADVYDEFQNIETSRKKYAEALTSIK